MSMLFNDSHFTKKKCAQHMFFPAPFRNESIYFEVNFQQRAEH